MKRSILSFVFELGIIATIATVLQIFAIILILRNTEEMHLIGIAFFFLMFSMALFLNVIYVPWYSIASLVQE